MFMLAMNENQCLIVNRCHENRVIATSHDGSDEVAITCTNVKLLVHRSNHDNLQLGLIFDKSWCERM